MSRRRGKYSLVYPSVQYYSAVEHCAVLPWPPRPPRNEGLISPSAGAAPGRQALAVSPFGGGGGSRFVLAETNSLTQSTILFLEKQPTSNAGLTGEWGQLEITLTGHAAPEVPLAEENSTTDPPMHPWRLSPRAPQGISPAGEGVQAASQLDFSLCSILLLSLPSKALDPKRPP